MPCRHGFAELGSGHGPYVLIFSDSVLMRLGDVDAVGGVAFYTAHLFRHLIFHGGHGRVRTRPISNQATLSRTAKQKPP